MPYYDIHDVVLSDCAVYLDRHAIWIVYDVTQSFQLALFRKVRSNLGTVLTPTPVTISNPPYVVSLEYADGLVGISIEVIVYEGFGSIQTAA